MKMTKEMSPVSIEVEHVSSKEIRITVRNEEPTLQQFQFMVTDPDKLRIAPSNGKIKDVAEICVTRVTEEEKVTKEEWETKLLLLVRPSKQEEAGGGDFFSCRDRNAVEHQYPITLVFRDVTSEAKSDWFISSGIMSLWKNFTFLGIVSASIPLFFWLFRNTEEEEKIHSWYDFIWARYYS